MRGAWAGLLAAALWLGAVPAGAGPSEAEIARLGGPELTPVGAERAGNAEGTIPEWKPVTKPPEGWKPGQRRIDLFAGDPVLFTIDASNVDRYRDKLTPGQVALVEGYDGYTMDVYPSRRSCGLPDDFYEAAKRNAREARVDDDCFLRAGIRTPVFPLPQNGCEAIQNGKLSAFGGVRALDRMEATLVPTKGGSFVPIRRRQALHLRANSPEYPDFESLEGVWTKSLTQTVSPAKQAGEITLVHALADGHLKAWTYNPGQRRVRRAPNFEYDNPVPGWQGLVTVDAVNGYVGAADRFDWKLLGKKEIYVPYNNHKFFDSSVSYADIIQPRYPRRDLPRYELHRVWVVEGTVKSTKRHVMPKRIFYIDEDTWQVVAVDNYDTRGNLWRVQESLPQLIYELPACVSNGTIFYDLVAGRYVVSPAFNEEEEGDYLAGHHGKVTDTGFAPDDLRRLGKR